MRFRQFLSVVPKSVKTAAPIIVSCAMLIGVVAGFFSGAAAGRVPADSVSSHVLGSLAGLGIGLLAGVVIAVWVICLGYVYADARRRAMPPILSTLMAIFVPNLLGFLIYFVIRRPIALPCAQCGQAMRADHPFCSWCGYQGPQASPTQGPSRPPSSGLNPTATA
jgi:hypothetical protein